MEVQGKSQPGSVGTWEGDTLVIDTVGFNDKFWFDRRGHPYTTATLQRGEEIMEYICNENNDYGVAGGFR